MKFLVIVLTVALFVSPKVEAVMEIGGGISSVTSGRPVPALNLVAGSYPWVVSVVSTGVRSGYSYMSAYSASFLKVWHAGKLFQGDVKAGFGLGIFYTERGFMPAVTQPLDKKSDVGAGPAIRVHWYFVNPAYLGVSGIFGLRDIGHNIALSYQDFILVSVGVGW